MSVSCIACSDKDTSKGIAKSMLGIEADSSSDEGKTSDETSEKDENNKESSGMEEEVFEDSSEVNDESDNASENNGDLTSEDNWQPVDIKDVETLFAFAPAGNYDESIIEILFAASDISYEELVKYQNFDIHEYEFSDEELNEELNVKGKEDEWVHEEGKDENKRLLLRRSYKYDDSNENRIVEKHAMLDFYSNNQDNIKTKKEIIYVELNGEIFTTSNEGISIITLNTYFNNEVEAQELFDRLSNAMSQSEGKFSVKGPGSELTRENKVGGNDIVSIYNHGNRVELELASAKWK